MLKATKHSFNEDELKKQFKKLEQNTKKLNQKEKNIDAMQSYILMHCLQKKHGAIQIPSAAREMAQALKEKQKLLKAQENVNKQIKLLQKKHAEKHAVDVISDWFLKVKYNPDSRICKKWMSRIQSTYYDKNPFMQ